MSIYRTLEHVHVPLYIVSNYVMLMNVWYMCMYPYILFLSISLYELCYVDECSRKCFFKKKKSVRFSMEDKIIQSKFMKDYKAIFRDSVGSGKHGK